MKTFKINFKEISKDFLLRFGCQTLNLQNYINNYFKINKKYIKLKENFYILSGFAFKSEEYENEGIPLYRITNINNDNKDFVYINEDLKETYKKFLLKENDITIGLTGDGKIKVDIITENDKYLLNQRVGALRILNNKSNIKFIFYLLKYNNIISKQFLYKSNGKTQLNISPNDLLNIKIPQIPLEAQNKAAEQITPIENKIQELKAQIQDPKTIINEVFAEEFNFNINKFEEIKKINKYYLKLKDIKDFRLSFSYIKNNNSSIYIKNFLIKKDSIYLKNILKKKIKRGIQPEYDENGEIIVIKTLNIQNGNIKYDNEIQFVNNDFFEKYKDRALIEKNDLLLTSTGAGRGKFAIYENNEEAIADSHISIIKLNNKFNIKYINFFCQSLFGENQLKYIETQIKGTPEIQEENLKYFLIPNIPLQKQQEIVDKIQTKINEQNKINDLIEKEREKINYIIENIVNS